MRENGARRVLADDAHRLSVQARKLRWRLGNDRAPNATPLFIVGLQRSGTKMLIYGLNESPEVQMYNESERSPAFLGFELRPDPVIRSLVERSRHTCIVFKALCDSGRVAELLDELGTPSPGRAIWIYRSMEGRARSAVARFQDNNLQVLRKIATGEASGTWQDSELTPRLRELISRFDYAGMTPESAAALWWYVHNSLFFDLELHERDDIILTSYDRFLTDPEGMMRSICSFAGISFDPRMSAGIAPRPAPSSRKLEIEAPIRALCSDLEARLDEWFERHGANPRSSRLAA